MDDQSNSFEIIHSDNQKKGLSMTLISFRGCSSGHQDKSEMLYRKNNLACNRFDQYSRIWQKVFD